METDVSKIVKSKLKSSYPKDVLDKAYLISFNPENLIFYGSYAQKAQYFTGDIDLIETVDDMGTREEAGKKICKELQRVVRKVMKARGVYLGDIKAGIDERFDVDIGKIENGVIKGFNIEEIKEVVSELPLTKKERKEIHELLARREPDDDSKKAFKFKRFLEVEEFFRQKKTLRWKRREIKDGKKKVGDKMLKLEDAVLADSLFKIDIIATMKNGRVVEITNVYEVMSNSNKTKDKQSKFAKSLKHNLIKYFFKGEYFKSTKRVYTLAKLMNDDDMIKKLIPLLNSGCGILHQCISEMKTIIYLVESYKREAPMGAIQNTLDYIKSKLSNVYEFSFHEAKVYEEINRLIALTNTLAQRADIIKSVQSLVEKLSKRLNEETFKYNESINLYPLKKSYFP